MISENRSKTEVGKGSRRAEKPEAEDGVECGDSENETEEAKMEINFGQTQSGLQQLFSLNPKLCHVTKGSSDSRDFQCWIYFISTPAQEAVDLAV